MAKLYVVCGHGAGDPGAGGHGYWEAERVRALAAEMQRQAGDEIIVGDTSINWYASNKFSSITPPGIPVLELHMDSASPDARGGHVIISGNYSADGYDTKLADFISTFFPGRANTLVRRTDLKNCNICARRGINYRLMECGFISNLGDVEKFNSNIGALAAGILNVFGIGEKTESTFEPTVDDPKIYPPAQIHNDVVTRVYNPSSGEHIYTADRNEPEALAELGWDIESTAWKNPPNIQMIYRLFNPYSGYHMYTVSHGEACRMVDEGWKYEGICGYASSVKTEHPVYRLYNPKADQHVFTQDANEVTILRGRGYNDEGVGFYALM